MCIGNNVGSNVCVGAPSRSPHREVNVTMNLALRGAAALMVAALLFVIASQTWNGQANAQTAPTLSASVEGDVVTLTLSGYHTKQWFFRIENGTCGYVFGSLTSSGQSGYKPGSYTAKAYAGFFDCIFDKNALAETTFTTKSPPVPPPDLTVKDGNVYIRFDALKDWWFTIAGTNCTKATSRNHGPVQNIGKSKDWTLTVSIHSDSGCSNEVASGKLAMPATSLSSSVKGNTVSLTLSNYAGEWWYKVTGGDCVKTSANPVSLVMKDAGDYTAKAYPVKSLCESDNRRTLGETDFSVKSPPKVDLTVVDGNVYIRFDALKDWWFTIAGTKCIEATSRNHGPVQNIGKSKDWTLPVSIYSDSACSNEVASGTLAMPATSLSSSVNGNTVSLALSNYAGGWWYKVTGGKCAYTSDNPVSLVMKDAGDYTAKAYPAQGLGLCLTDNRRTLGESSFTVEPPPVPPSLDLTVVDGSVYIRLDGLDEWWFSIAGTNCTKATSRNHGPVQNLGKSKDWILPVSVYSDSACSNEVASGTLAMPATSLSSSVNGKSVSLTLSNYAGEWWYKVAGGECVKTSDNPISFVMHYAGDYTAKAYSDGGLCVFDNHRTLGETNFTLESPPKVDLTVVDGNVYIRLDGLNEWWFSIAGTNCIKATSRNHGPVQNLGKSKDWILPVSVYSDSACSNEVTSGTLAMPATSLSSSVNDKTVSLTLSNYAGEWWYKVTGGECVKTSANSVSLVMDDAGDYTAKAYPVQSLCVSDNRRTLGETSFTVEPPPPPPSLDLTVVDGSVYIRLDGLDDWWFTIDGGSCAEATSRNHGPIQGYGQSEKWRMTVNIYSDSACSDQVASGSLTMPATSLSSSVSGKSVSLTLANYAGDWWYQLNGTSVCTQASGETVIDMSGYRSGTYTIKAYASQSDCDAGSNSLGETTFSI